MKAIPKYRISWTKPLWYEMSIEHNGVWFIYIGLDVRLYELETL